MDSGESVKGTIRWNIISSIHRDAYIINVTSVGDQKFDELTIAVIYKSNRKNEWYISCNIGKFTCNSGIMAVIVPNTEEDSLYFQENTRLFSPTFPKLRESDYNMGVLLDPSEEYEITGLTAVFVDMMGQNFDRLDETQVLFHNFIEPKKTYAEHVRNYLFCYNNRIASGTNFYDDILEKFPSRDFLKEQFTFNMSLTPKERNILQLYSFKGDRLLNKYIRNGKVVNKDIISYYTANKQVFDDMLGQKATLESLLQEFYFQMKRLFSRAPVVEKEFIVYRGSKTADHFNGTVDNIYVDRGFCSTSLNATVAVQYFAAKSYMSVIHVTIGTHCIYNMWSNYPYEYEIILNDETYFLMTKDWQDQTYMQEENLFLDPANAAVTIKTNECILLNA